ncbi:hypothetical protein HHK36_026949 [Tetracentron sinense]|uniref:Anthocyanin acyltransferase n=1 Tax=Tetracentron sinense TaxID=13715 RepID=A0A834YKD6_TETSI|nr:hypothetical protein HHK36_026949 [Tetracentron sinense]
MAPPNAITVLEHCRVAPPPDSITQTSLPLTIFDLPFLRFPLVQIIYFYEYPHSKTHFLDSVLPKLKHSLSLTLQHFYPLAGNLRWSPESEKPIILYVNGDSVSLTIAESNNDFYHLSGNHARNCNESHSLLPHLPSSETLAPLLALQFTVFPNYGFCIGIIIRHVIVDGQSSTMFLKSWASICRSGDSSLSPELLPFYDRTVIKDPEGLEKFFLNKFVKSTESETEFNIVDPRAPSNTVKTTFELSRGDIERLKKWVLTRREKDKQTPPLHLSTLVLTCAYVWVCLIRADVKRKRIQLVFPVDCRARLDPPIPLTYFGNCVVGYKVHTEPCDIMGEDGLVMAVEELNKVIRGLESGIHMGTKKKIPSPSEEMEAPIGIAWSNRYRVYETDFGWGRPTKAEMISIEKTGAMSLVESRDGAGGVEVGLALNKQEMEVFASIFTNGLNALGIC